MEETPAGAQGRARGGAFAQRGLPLLFCLISGSLIRSGLIDGPPAHHPLQGQVLPKEL